MACFISIHSSTYPYNYKVNLSVNPNDVNTHYWVYFNYFVLHMFNRYLGLPYELLHIIGPIFNKKIVMIKPTQKTPELELDLINDTRWSLHKQSPDKYTLLVFYRGLHCPVCKKYLEDLKTKLKDFSNRGVNVIALSMDSEERAKKTGKEWDIESLPIGFELSEKAARDWGLFISNSISEKEPKIFSEPGLFLVKADGTLYCSAIQTMPFARPDFDDLLKAIDFIEDKDYPARGSK